MGRVKKTRWIRFGIVSFIFFAWVAWLGNWWVALWWFLLADIYLTQFIPWNWWKFSKSKVVRTVMSWVDAIVYALILVYFLFAFVGQNYQIPSSSLEKTLLTGDFLWVNKMVYGPRVPMTPIHFPLAQNEIFGIKSYIEHPQFKYHRLKGFRNVERGDIVVFNFPAGDTVVVGRTNPDYYTQVMEFGAMKLAEESNCIPDTIYRRLISNPSLYGLLMEKGRNYLRSSFDIIYRPVDRRDNYVKRCVGLPGERIAIKNGRVYINGEVISEPKNVQYNYDIYLKSGFYDDSYLIDELGMARSDFEADEFKDHRVMDEKGVKYLHDVPLTYEMKSKLEGCSWVTRIDPSEIGEGESLYIYPVGKVYGWTRSNFANDIGGLWIPKKGGAIDLTNKRNQEIYARCIHDYECVDLTIKNGKAYIDGKQVSSYTFKMDYYWMMGDNRDNSLDSRFWGFVPEDHIVGTPMFVIVSFDKEKGWFDGKIRWNRIFRDANPDK
ncbi:MAG: S26 family signal peptidase [Muribaculaceae bacterium]|nr:S26 family signal peptidase [Muribaculaceae bacterium]